MSQSSQTRKIFGSLDLKQDLKLKTGSTSTVAVQVVPTAVTALADADATLTIAQLKAGILTMTPTVTRALVLPTAALVNSFLKVAGDSFNFTIINLGADTKHITVAAGANGSVVGFATVRDSDATAASDTGSANFRLVLTNAVTPTYVVYRV
jgi:hypothetical protein